MRRRKFRGLGGPRVYKGAIRGRQNGNPSLAPFVTEPLHSPETPKTEPKPIIWFLIGELSDGGAERVFVNYVRHAQSVKPVVVLNNSKGRMYSLLPKDCLIEFLGRDDSPDSATESGQSFLGWLRDTRVGHYLGIVHQALRTPVYSWRMVRIANRTGASVVSCFLMESPPGRLAGETLVP